MKNKVGVVTGGASGIGEAIVQRLLRDGARVYAVDISAESLQRLESMCASDSLTAIAADISDANTASRVVSRCLEETGRVDFLVNVAGVMHPPLPLTELALSDYERVMSVNLKGSFLFYQAVAKEMIKLGKGGSIVNISSTAGIRPVAGAGAYAASKHGVIGLTTSAALEGAAHGIRINAICPGVINTPLYRANVSGGPAEEMIKHIPMQRVGESDEIANATAWLLGDQASYVTGVVLPVDGGVSLI